MIFGLCGADKFRGLRWKVAGPRRLGAPDVQILRFVRIGEEVAATRDRRIGRVESRLGNPHRLAALDRNPPQPCTVVHAARREDETAPVRSPCQRVEQRVVESQLTRLAASCGHQVNFFRRLPTAAADKGERLTVGGESRSAVALKLRRGRGQSPPLARLDREQENGAASVAGIRVEDELPAGAKYLGSDPPAELNGERLAWRSPVA